MNEDVKYCQDCDNDFYNGNNPMGIKKCWGLESAKAVVRYKIGWWVSADRLEGRQRENFIKVTTYNCHTEGGRFAFLDRPPRHLTGR